MDFEQIYNEYYRDVYYYSLSFIKNQNEAEEITQETFVKALTSINISKEKFCFINIIFF